MSEFKIGDEVVITAITAGYKGILKVGDLAVIGRFQGEIIEYARMASDNNNSSCWHSVGCFELAPEEIETVEYKGQVLQIGQLYEFSDVKDTEGYIHRLTDIYQHDRQYPYHGSNGCGWKYIKAINQSKLGTLTPAPVELIDNAPYMFEVSGCKFLGFYEKSQEAFFDNDEGGNEIAELSHCTNIRLMTVGDKK